MSEGSVQRLSLRSNNVAGEGALYNIGSWDEPIVCKRFSSHFVNQPQRGGLPQVLEKWLKNKGVSDSAAAQ
jgi:hypothetical protein